jgi:hypothetical protein
MASSSKRKRSTKNPHAAEFEIVRPSHQDAAQPSATARTVTFDRHADGRLGQQTEFAEVQISAEDLAALAQDPEFSSLPDDETLNFEYFEHTVQEDDKQDDPVVHQVPAKGKNKVKPVRLNWRYNVAHLLIQYLSFRTYLQNGCLSVTPMSTN